jgi:hypothetical protein
MRVLSTQTAGYDGTVSLSLLSLLHPPGGPFSLRVGVAPRRATHKCGGGRAHYLPLRRHVAFPVSWSFRETRLPALEVELVGPGGAAVASGRMDLSMVLMCVRGAKASGEGRCERLRARREAKRARRRRPLEAEEDARLPRPRAAAEVAEEDARLPRPHAAVYLTPMPPRRPIRTRMRSNGYASPSPP